MSILEELEHGRIAEMSYPTRVVYGAGALDRLPALLERLKVKRPLIVTDAGVVQSGIAERVFGDLQSVPRSEGGAMRFGSNGRATAVFDGRNGNGRIHTLSRGIRCKRVAPARRRARD